MNIAIKGHPTRGKEVIQLLEMLGGVNAFNLDGTMDNYYYYIDENSNKIYHCLSINVENVIVYTLEKFEESFPYKVGNKVWLYYKNLTIRTIETITCMRWCNKCNCILYDVSTYCNLRKSAFTPYKEENMEEEEIIEPITEINLNHPEYKRYDEIELIIPDDWEFEQRGNKMFGIRKQSKYPKTYEECCKILNIPFNGNIVYAGHWVYGGEYLEKHLDVLRKFQQLLICRDAYWKIAGDFEEKRKEKAIHYVIYSTLLGEVGKETMPNCIANYLLDFPTAEMRDAFYENFKELIEQCKELL